MYDYSMTIAGRKVSAKTRFEVRNPATQELLGFAPNAALDDLGAAVAAAKAAFPGWARRPDSERKAACHAIAQKLGEHAEELAQILTREQGKPLGGMGSRFELAGARAWAASTADLAQPVKVLQDDGAGRVELHRKPIGVVGSITPWNWPLMIAVWHIVPALRVGNTVVIKPSPLTPLSTLRMIEILNGILPPGVLNVVSSDDKLANIGAAMSSHPDIGKIAFTGSSATGEKVMANAARTLKRLTLELGGNDAGIVLPDADPTAIAAGLFWGAFINSGQTCAAMKRLYVHDSLHDAVCDALVAHARTVPMGNGLDEHNLLGPVNNRPQFDKVSRLAVSGARQGRVRLGGSTDDSLFFPVTLISDLPADAPLVVEEQFGPVLPILRYRDVDEAIAAANASENGLGGSVWSRDISRARDVALRLECGSAWVNKHGAIQPNAPFGGMKRSGFGVEFGEEGLAENTHIQVLFS